MAKQTKSLSSLLGDIRSCDACRAELPLGPRPIVAAHKDSTILIIGQAPGNKVHESGIPWDDPSGDRLREWMGIDKAAFYDHEKIALMPMGFCYPGKGKSGDLPPIQRCAELWHSGLLEKLTNVKLTLLIGSYAQGYYLGEKRKRTLTATVEAWRDFQPSRIPLPHPSPRNNIWLRKNEWFETDVLPYLRRRVTIVLKQRPDKKPE